MPPKNRSVFYVPTQVGASLSTAYKSKYTKNGKSATTAKGKQRTYKLKNGGSRTTRKKQDEGVTHEQSYVVSSYKLGRKPKYSVRQIRKVVKTNENKLVFGAHPITRFGGTAGQINLINSQASAGTTLIAPCCMFDLTSVPNDVAGSITQPNTCHYISFTNETATASVVYNCMSSNTKLAQENTPQGSSTIVDNYPLSTSILRWVQAKMMFYAPTSLPAKFNVMLCQFKDPRLIPDWDTSSTKTGDAFATGFWQSFLKKYMYNPVEVSNPTYDKYLKILWSNTFVMNPKENTESPNTRYKQVDLFKWVNRKCTYNWEDKDKISMVAAELQANIGQNATSVAPRARIFLVIRAMAGYVSNSLTPDITKHPSFDIVVRTCHSQFS